MVVVQALESAAVDLNEADLRISQIDLAILDLTKIDDILDDQIQTPLRDPWKDCDQLADLSCFYSAFYVHSGQCGK